MSTPNEAIVSLQKPPLAQDIDPTQDDILFPEISQRELAWLDIKEGFQKWRIWTTLAYQDIKLRYRRSVLGPFWITISMAITVYTMGFLYAQLFHQSLQKFYPFLVAGMLGWSLISTIVNELTDGMTTSDGYLKSIKLPYSLFIHRLATRNIIIFFHNIVVIVPILVLFHQYASINFKTLLLFPGLLIIYVNTINYGLVIGLIGARYRDVSQVTRNLVQIIFFITPIMWGPEMLTGRKHWLVDLNPFYAFIECVRQPLLGSTPTLKNLTVVAITTLLGFILSFKLFLRYRSRIIYWL